jgi:hypothetical protein
MKLIRCDRHPDREAVATFRIIQFPPGARPILFGYTSGMEQMIDLCKECADKVQVIKEKNASG